MEHFRDDNSLKKQQRREKRIRDRRRMRENLYLLFLCALTCTLYLTYVYKTYVEPVQVTAESSEDNLSGAGNGAASGMSAGNGAASGVSAGNGAASGMSAGNGAASGMSAGNGAASGVSAGNVAASDGGQGNGGNASPAAAATGDAGAAPGAGTTAASGTSADAAPGTDAAADSEPGTTSLPVCIAHPESIPDYAGQDVLELSDGNTSFTEEELNSITGEHFSALDSLGRCGTVYAMLHRSMMPTGERGSIREIRPSGWNQEKYPGIVDSDPPYLWNRSHLIAYGMTGQTANERNLITGSRYMNATTMLPYEEEVMGYLRYSGNHILYRVTPYFKGTELVARGVEMEAYSVEDLGRGVCFHVFVYNVQPGIGIDYQTGDSWKE